MSATSMEEPSSYSQRMVAFVDVLGFGSLVNKSGNDSALAPKIIKRITDGILWTIEELEDSYQGIDGVIFTQFSDSFVLSIEAPPTENNIRFSRFAYSLLNVIHCFIGSNLLLRGGITVGSLIHTKELLFGPAMNRAYELESKIAKYPRIIVDPELPEVASSLMAAPIRRDRDNLRYIDYFSAQQVFFLVPGRWRALQIAIEDIPNTPQLQDKRNWLVRKYNKAISGFSFDGFKMRLDDYVDDTDAINAVIEDYEKLLSNARAIHIL